LFDASVGGVAVVTTRDLAAFVHIDAWAVAAVAHAWCLAIRARRCWCVALHLPLIAADVEHAATTDAGWCIDADRVAAVLFADDQAHRLAGATGWFGPTRATSTTQEAVFRGLTLAAIDTTAAANSTGASAASGAGRATDSTGAAVTTGGTRTRDARVRTLAAAAYAGSR
jgi:hypothetical protein